MHLTFYGDIHKKITDHDYIQIGVDLEQNRIYFQGGTSVNGYKLTSTGNVVNIRSTNYFVEKLAAYVGVYDLLFDEDQKLYYIQLVK